MSSDTIEQDGQLHSDRKQIAILDFGSQYSHLIARRVRELNVFCELYSCLVKGEILRKNHVVGVILSGGPSSVYEPDSPHVDADVWKMIEENDLPVLGICYGMQEMAHVLGGRVAPGQKREYGKAMVRRNPEFEQAASLLFNGIGDETQMWMSHGDKIHDLPEGFVSIGVTDNSEHAAIAHPDKKMFGLQFHPEVTHSIGGKAILENFVVGMCHAPTDWNMTDIANEFIENVRKQVGPNGRVIGAVSGGVDSSVAAVLLQRAIGDRFHAVMVDSGCLRKDEGKQVVERLRNKLGINLHLVNAENLFLSRLEGVTDPEKKRKIIGTTFIDVFDEESKKIGDCDFLLQGTLYPDVIESISYKGPSAVIKSHHNVGGLPARMNLKLIEPLRELFKDEVRSLGIALGIEEESVWRHPFPGPGLAIRVIGEVTKEKLDTLREADQILIDELHNANIYREIGQAFCVLTNTQSVGVMGDGRTYEALCGIRCVTTTDYMTADWYHMDYNTLGKISNRIINEVRGINRCAYDVSSKPPATIEWE